jgi:hypothetical protein
LICENVVPFVYLLLFVPQVKSYLVIGTSAVYANIDFVTKFGFLKNRSLILLQKYKFSAVYRRIVTIPERNGRALTTMKRIVLGIIVQNKTFSYNSRLLIRESGDGSGSSQRYP